ncbi:MAG: flavin reductase family protein [Solirubrobacteraceae bacterium]|nr:flavin reductase family protein [Patulibacter sp.]
MRRELPAHDLSSRESHRLLTASVLPRPIAWVSTRSRDGIDNLAPYSFFTAVSSDPPVLQFSSIGLKDTVRNILDTGEFVICVTTLDLMEQVNATAEYVAPDVDEFALAGLRREASAAVRPARVAGAPVAFECRMRSVCEIGNGHVVMGDVVHVAVAESVVGDDGLPDAELMRPVSRLGRNEWAGLGDLRRLYLPRPARA